MLFKVWFLVFAITLSNLTGGSVIMKGKFGDYCDTRECKITIERLNKCNKCQKL